jgi:hypothetical protein
VADAVPRIEESTNLTFKTPPRVETRSREQIREFLLESVKEERTQRDIAGQQAVYRRLGLVSDTLDLGRLVVETLTEQIAGYYDPRTDVLYIPTDAPREQVRLVIAHELVHALQDQYLDIDSLQRVDGRNDETTAGRAVLEGQATLVSLRLLGQQMVTWDLQRQRIREAQSSMPVFAGAPLIIQETLLFPYLSGADFVGRFHDERADGNPLAPDALPRSTEQIMHREAYFDAPRDAPTRVTLPEPDGAESTYENELGEFELRVLIFHHLRDQNLATRVAAGWDGDRYAVLRAGGGDGIVWLTVWDTPVDAAEFADAMSLLVAKRYPDAFSRRAEGGAKRYYTREREIVLWGGEVAGRAAVLYSDVPSGTRTDLIDLGKVKVEE